MCLACEQALQWDIAQKKNWEAEHSFMQDLPPQTTFGRLHSPFNFSTVPH